MRHNGEGTKRYPSNADPQNGSTGPAPKSNQPRHFFNSLLERFID